MPISKGFCLVTLMPTRPMLAGSAPASGSQAQGIDARATAGGGEDLAIVRDPKVFLIDNAVSKRDAPSRTRTRLELFRHPASPFVTGFIGSARMNPLQDAVAARIGCKTC